MRMNSPFDAADEILLTRPPIVRALVQLQFAPVLSIVEDSYVAPFQERMRPIYPLTTKAHAVQLLLGPEGVAQQAGEQLWRLSSSDGWSLTLAPGFLSVDTTSYTDRRDLVERVRAALVALSSLVGPSTPWLRLGVRYVNRLDDDEYDDLETYVSPDALGARALAIPEGVSLVHSLSETQFDTGSSTGLTVRWGVLPAGVSVTPDVAPATTASWVLDIDSFSLGRGEFVDADDIAARTRLHCDATYRAFRWAVLPALLTARGGHQ